MNAILFDQALTDEDRRKALYEGQLMVYSPTPNSLRLVEFARTMIREAFGSVDPETAQFKMPVEQFAAVLSDLKPKFIHHPTSKECLQTILKELGCNLEKTYFDVPRMRSSTSDGYLTTGIAYAFHPHRDTWYSAPFCQLNWWIPIYDISPGNGMAFHPHYWSNPLRNSSRDYNYQEWNRTSRFAAAQQIGKDTRKQPHPEEEVKLDPQLRVVTKPGGILIFSAAHLHSSIPNQTGKTRFSIDFRSVNVDDVAKKIGAANVDSECSGSTMEDYLRGTDLQHLPREVIASYDDGPPQKARFSSSRVA